MQKQLELFIWFDIKRPTFNEWYHENCSEKRRSENAIYSEEQGEEVYNELVKSGFFENGGL